MVQADNIVNNAACEGQSDINAFCGPTCQRAGHKEKEKTKGREGFSDRNNGAQKAEKDLTVWENVDHM